MDGAFLPITTSRLVLRAFRPGDAPAFAAYRSDPEVARYQSWDAPFPLADAERFVAAMVALTGPQRGEWIQVAIDRDGELLGDVAVGLDAAGDIATIGYTLAPAHQRRGYAREAVGAVVDALFDRLGVHRVEASLDPRNVASARLVEALGFAAEGIAREAVRDGDGWADDARYGLTATARAARRPDRDPPRE